MGASIYVRWPGNSDEEQGGHPGFDNDDNGYAWWITDILKSPPHCYLLRDNGVGALLHVVDPGDSDRKVKWVHPSEVRDAARRLAQEITQNTPMGQNVVEFYTRGDDSPREELLSDLANVATIAEYALSHGASQMALAIGW